MITTLLSTITTNNLTAGNLTYNSTVQPDFIPIISPNAISEDSNSHLQLSYVAGVSALLALSSILIFVVVSRKGHTDQQEQGYICQEIDPIDYKYEENSCYIIPHPYIESHDGDFGNYYSQVEDMNNYNMVTAQTYDMATAQTYDMATAQTYDMVTAQTYDMVTAQTYDMATGHYDNLSEEVYQ